MDINPPFSNENRLKSTEKSIKIYYKTPSKLSDIMIPAIRTLTSNFIYAQTPYKFSLDTLAKVSNAFFKFKTRRLSTMTRPILELNVKRDGIVEKASVPYQTLCTEYYELDKPNPPEDGFAFYCKLADEANGPILEPMCGSGRFLIPMSKKGYNIVGFDTSSRMLKVGRKKCKDEEMETKLVNASFETFRSNDRFELIFIPGGSICLLTEKEQMAQALSRVFDLLAKKGKFTFEIDTLSSFAESQDVWKGHWIDKPDGSKLVLNTFAKFDAASRVNTTLCRYELWVKNRVVKTEVEDFRVRLYELEEMENLLQYHGFKVVNASVPYTGAKPDKKTDCIVLECVKN